MACNPPEKRGQEVPAAWTVERWAGITAHETDQLFAGIEITSSIVLSSILADPDLFIITRACKYLIIVKSNYPLCLYGCTQIMLVNCIKWEKYPLILQRQITKTLFS
jgi:hypothetical protein